MTKFIKAHHPATGGQSSFEEQAFHAVWADLGWVEGPLPGSDDEPEPMVNSEAVQQALPEESSVDVTPTEEEPPEDPKQKKR